MIYFKAEKNENGYLCKIYRDSLEKANKFPDNYSTIELIYTTKTKKTDCIKHKDDVEDDAIDDAMGWYVNKFGQVPPPILVQYSNGDQMIHIVSDFITTIIVASPKWAEKRHFRTLGSS